MELFQNTIIGKIGRHTSIQLSELDTPFYGWIMNYQRLEKDRDDLKKKLEKQLKMNGKLYIKVTQAGNKLKKFGMSVSDSKEDFRQP